MSEIHPLINPESKHYESDGRNRIFDIEKKLSVTEMIGAARFNIEKYDFRKDKKGQRNSDIAKLTTYINYLACLSRIEDMLKDIGEQPYSTTVYDAIGKLNIAWGNWKEWVDVDHR